MSKNNLITLHCFGREIGKLGYDADRGASFFQYHETFLKEGLYPRLFPFIFKRIPHTQVFDRYNNDTFRGLPPMIADSLPDLFGNIIFKAWMESTNRDMHKISALEQLAYVGTRGMGALEYVPAKKVAAQDSIDIDEIAAIAGKVLQQKSQTSGRRLDHASLLNIFRIGSSAGGARPKILVSENKTRGTIIPGDMECSEHYDHYLVKLAVEASASYSRELVEYSYYLAATQAGIHIMPSKMIGGKHFATLRFDRQGGRKNHVLTACGIAGLDFHDPKLSRYENLFDLALALKCPHRDIEQLFRRMVFNLVFANHDDHLKNQSFIYDETADTWGLAPAYDLTYSLNPELNIKTRSRALSINGKRTDISLKDLAAIAEQYTVKNYRKIVAEIQDAVPYWEQEACALGVSKKTIHAMTKNFQTFL